jgi:mannose-6-phosphate isomerase-like protein (cupin superfamily)
MGMELDVRHPQVLARGEGEVITEREARFVALLVDRPEVTVTISRYDEGEEGPPPHLHRAHADSFLVLEGTLRFGIADEFLDLGAGEALVAPPGLVHTFLNERPEPAWWLNVHTPDAGFAAMMRARRDGHDLTEPWDSFDADPTEGLPRAAAFAGTAFACPWLRVERLVLGAGDEAERRLDDLAVVTVLEGAVQLRADGLDARMERHGVTAVPPGLRWRIGSTEEAAQLVVTEIAQP